MATLFYLNQFFTTTLNVGGGIDSSQTSDIVLSSVSGLDITKPGIALLTYSDPLNTANAEWITYTSIDGSNELQGVVRGAEGYSAKAHGNGAAVAFPLSESHINNLAAMFDTTGLDLAEIATPSSPASGRNKLYFKSDDKVYKLNSAGTEVEIGTGGKYQFIVPGTIATGTDVAGTWFVPDTITIDEVDLYVNTAGATGNTVVNVLKNGTTIFPTTAKPTLAGTATSDLSNIPDTTSAVEGDKITIDVTSVTTTAPTDLYLIIKYS